MNDNVNNPKHYTSHPSGVECITVTEHFGFNVGNAVFAGAWTARALYPVVRGTHYPSALEAARALAAALRGDA